MDDCLQAANGQSTEVDTAQFAAFLQKKKINASLFQAQQPLAFITLCVQFNSMGEAAFDQRKKFLINDWRLMFPPSIKQDA